MLENYFSIAIYDALETFEYKYGKNFEAECLYNNSKKTIIPLVYKLNNFFNKKHNLKKLVQKNTLNLNNLIKLFYKDFKKLKNKKITLLFVFTVNSLKVLKKLKIKEILFPDYPYLHIKFSLFIPKKRINNIDKLKENDKILKFKKYLLKPHKIILKFAGGKYEYLNVDANLIPLALKFKYDNKFDGINYSFAKLIKLYLKNIEKIKHLSVNYIGKIDFINTYKYDIKNMEQIMCVDKVITNPQMSNKLSGFYIKKLKLNIDNKNWGNENNIYFNTSKTGSYDKFILSGYFQKKTIKINGVYYIKNLIIDKNFEFEKELNINIITTYPCYNIRNYKKKLIKIKITSLINSYYNKDFKKTFQKTIKNFLFKKYANLIHKKNIMLDCIIGIDEFLYEHKNLQEKIRKDFFFLVDKEYKKLQQKKKENLIVKLNKNEYYYELKYYNNILFSI